MRIGIFSGAKRALPNFDTLVQAVNLAEKDGFSHYWFTHLPAAGFDALTTIALVGRTTSCIELGTAALPIYPQHPWWLAQHALTVQAASGGRLTLGIGLSYKPIIENMLGLSY